MRVDQTGSLESAMQALEVAARHAPALGTVVGDRFVLLRRLGEGAFGFVYEAADRLDGGRVALKVMRGFGREWPDRFKREFRSLRDLEHPHLISLYELFFADERWFFTMELIEGDHLIPYVRGGAPVAEPGAFDEARARSAFAQLASALAALHTAGKVHRDVKPSNVMVTREDRVVLLDLGLVTDVMAHDLAGGRHIVGTPGYMAPEQATLDDVGPPADMYAVGVMLYEMLTGRLPFSSDPQRILLDKLSPASPAEPRGVPRDLAALAALLLHRDPKARPTARDLLRRLAPPEAHPAEAIASAPPSERRLIGRGEQLARIEGAFDAAASGCCALVSVIGPSGIGKTAFVRAFVERLRDEGRALVLASTCYERESVPFKAFDDLMESLARHLIALPEAQRTRFVPDDVGALERMFPVFRFVQPSDEVYDDPSEPRGLRRRAFEAFRDVLMRLSAERPLVVWLDDVQWADVESAELLVSLFRPSPPSSLLVILSHRAAEGQVAFLEAVGALPPGDVSRIEIALSPLARDESRTLARTVLGDAAATDAEVVAVETDGNPFFIREFASFLRDRPQPADVAGAPKLDVSLEEMILGRVRKLPSGAQRLLEVVSIAGTPIGRRTAFLAAQLESDGYRSLAVLRSGQLVRTRGAGTGDVLVGYHDRITAAVVGALAADERRARHRDIAAALEREGNADPEALAEHYRGADDLAAASVHAVLAARQAASSLAFDRAARLYKLALDVGRYEGAKRTAIERALGDALANAGHGKAAADVYLDAAARADPRDATELRRRAGEQLLRSGHVDDGFRTIETVLRAVGVRPVASARAALVSLVARRAFLAARGYGFSAREEARVPAADVERLDAVWSATVTAGVIDTMRGAELQARHVTLALRVGEPYRVARALGFEVAHLASLGSPGRRTFEKLSVRARALAAEVGHPHAMALCDLAEGMGASVSGELRAGVERCDAAERVFRSRCPGAGWEVATARIFAAIGLALLGEIRELRRRADLHDQERADGSDRYAAWVPLSGYSVLAHLAADRVDDLRDAVRDALSHWSKRVFTLQHHWASVGLAIADLYTGDEQRALARLSDEERAHRSAQFFQVESVRINFRVLQVRCLLASRGAGRVRDLRQAARLIGGIEREKASWARPIADMTAGALAWRLGREKDAVRRLTSAAHGFDAHEMKLFAAAARWRLGEIEGGDAGAAAVERSRAMLAAETIADPKRFARALVPSYRDEG